MCVCQWLLDEDLIACLFTCTAEGNKALLSPNQDSDSDEEGQEKKPGDQAKGKKKNDQPSDSIAEVGTVQHKLINDLKTINDLQ